MSINPNRWTIGVKLPAAFAAIALASSILIGVVGFTIARNVVIAEAEGDLLDLTVAHKAEIDEFLDHVDEDLELLSTHPWTVRALRAFASGWTTLGSTAREHLQEVYGPGGDPASDDSFYSRYNAQYGPWLSEFAEHRGYDDIYLISIKGDVLFSTAKEEDFATNLVDGPYAESGFGETFRRLRDAYAEARKTDKTPDLHAHEIAFSDYGFYAPTRGEPAAFHGHILADVDGSALGALFFQLSDERLQETVGVKAGFGLDGETILVGADGLLRSASVRWPEGAILRAQVDNDAVSAALSGGSGVREVPDWSKGRGDSGRGIDIVAYVPIEVFGLTWALLGVKPVGEVVEPVYEMAWDLALTAAGATLLVIGVGMISARRITGPILSLAGLTRRVVDGETGVGVPHLDRQDEIGEMARALEVFKDDSEQIRRLGEAVEAERRTLHEVLDSSPEPMFVVDEAGTILRANVEAERVFEYAPGTLAGQSIDALVPDDVRPRHAALRAGFVREGTTRAMRGGDDLRGRARSGKTFPIEAALSSLHAPDGSTQVIAAVRDITERRKAERELIEAKDAAEEATRAKAAFLATMSHEIRTPMNGVLSMIQVLDQTGLDAEQRGMTRIVRDSSEALLTIIDDILDFSKIEAGRLEIETIPVDPRTVVESVGELLAGRAEQRGIGLITDIDPAMPKSVEADPTRIRQILLNLGGNAVKFTERGHVRITAAVADGRLVVEVADSGIGMSPEQCGKLFQPFQQADTSTSRRFGGTGLGLSICRRLVDLMAGDISVSSVAGEGSTFRFEIPVAVLDDNALVPEHDISGAQVLLVGHSAVSRDLISRYLEAAGLPAPAHAGTTVDAHALIAEGDFDLVLVDGLLGDREALAFEADEHREAADLKIALTAPRGLASTIAEARRRAFLTVLTEPLSMAGLWRVVAAALDLAPLQEEDQADTGEVWTPPDMETARAAEAAILVAEDNPTNQTVIRQILGRMGFAHDLTENGVEALDAWRTVGPGYGLVLTDFHMPEMDGFELTEAIRAEEAGSQRRVPILALTADALPGTEQRCFDAGMDGYLTKPIDLERLAGALAAHLPQAMPLRRTPDPTETAATTKATGAGPLGTIDREIFDVERVTEAFGAFDADAQAFLVGFLEAVPTMIGELEAAAAAGNADAGRRAAHTLKGSAKSVGADRLGQIASDVQDSYDADDAETAGILTELLRPTYDELVAALAPLALPRNGDAA